jgi:hypothetical protein
MHISHPCPWHCGQTAAGAGHDAQGALWQDCLVPNKEPKNPPWWSYVAQPVTPAKAMDAINIDKARFMDD